MEEDRMPKKIFTQELEGTRRRGRPRKRWKEEVERALQVLGVRRWRELVADRKKMEVHCSTGQSPQWAVVPMKEEEDLVVPQLWHGYARTQKHTHTHALFVFDEASCYSKLIKQYSQCTYNITLRRVRANIVVVGKQCVLHIVRIWYPACNVRASYCVVTCGLSAYTIFFHIIAKM